MKYSTFVKYAGGRSEIIPHKNKPEMERVRKTLSSMHTVSFYRTPKPQDFMEMRNV